MAAWLDPLVAMIMSVWLIYAWGGQAYYNVMNLVGLSATPPFLQKLTYLCWNHDPRILQIDTVRCSAPSPPASRLTKVLCGQIMSQRVTVVVMVNSSSCLQHFFVCTVRMLFSMLAHPVAVRRAYTFGDSYLAEVDIVLPASMSVAESHDIAEELQASSEPLLTHVWVWRACARRWLLDMLEPLGAILLAAEQALTDAQQSAEAAGALCVRSCPPVMQMLSSC